MEIREYSQRSPWDKSGVFVGDQVTDSETAIKTANLDWTVSLQPVFFSKDMIGSREVPTHKAIVRDCDDMPLGIVGNRYEPLQNRDAFTFMDSLVETGQVRYHTVGTVNGGRKIWLLAKVSESEVLPHDPVENYILLYNSHNGSNSLTVGLVNMRVACANAIQMAFLQAKEAGLDNLKIRHTRSLKERISEAQEILKASNSRFAEFNSFAEHLTKIKMSSNRWEEMLKSLLPDPKDKEMKRLATIRGRTRDKLTELFHYGTGQDIPGVAGTGWAAYNAFTEYANYEKPARGENRQEKRFESSILNGNNSLLTRATKEILSLAA